MGVLARTPRAQIEHALTAFGPLPPHREMRKPETGLVTLRGRIGGGGDAFNMGEATVTRASIRLETGEVGHAYALGRDASKARLSALIDAAFQNPSLHDCVIAKIFEPLARAEADGERRKTEETAATKVDFFTMVRGED
ncbi:MAG: phosphonate C-P lyase system protein PhnG [Aliihoeflea sp.]|uniref:phosphonate C-P lyase system protein PhnG n=1 Tax=Aliihoeflea sp. TaxID=2608088 RepID=UPI0040332B09